MLTWVVRVLEQPHLHLDLDPLLRPGCGNWNLLRWSVPTDQGNLVIAIMKLFTDFFGHRPPEGCMQYHTGLTGRITTFNFDQATSTSQQHLRTQEYSICIRPEEGYCCVQYTPCTDERSWTIDLNNAAVANLATETNTLCTEDYVGISGKYQRVLSIPLSIQYNTSIPIDFKEFLMPALVERTLSWIQDFAEEFLDSHLQAKLLPNLFVVIN